MHDLLEAEPQLGQELTSMVQQHGLETIISAIKTKQEKKKHKVNKKAKVTWVVSKAAFIDICKEYSEDGITEESLNAMTETVQLSEGNKGLYKVEVLEKLFKEVE